MSANGHLPEGAQLATLEILRQANTAYRKLPQASARLGQDVWVQIRSIRHADYADVLPILPPESREWPPDGDARAAAYEAWLEAQSPEAKAERQALVLRISWRVIAKGVIVPSVTEETATAFASDADWLSNEILVFSGILKAPEPQPA